MNEHYVAVAVHYLQSLPPSIFPSPPSSPTPTRQSPRTRQDKNTRVKRHAGGNAVLHDLHEPHLLHSIHIPACRNGIALPRPALPCMRHCQGFPAYMEAARGYCRYSPDMLSFDSSSLSLAEMGSFTMFLFAVRPRARMMRELRRERGEVRVRLQDNFSFSSYTLSSTFRS